MAALKRSGEEEWKKRVLPTSSLNDEAASSTPKSTITTKTGVNIIKLQQEQIRQQLQNITPKPKPLHTSELAQKTNKLLAAADSGSGGVPPPQSRRNVLHPVNSNSLMGGDSRCFESNESLDSIDMEKKNSAAVTKSKRITCINPSDVFNNGELRQFLIWSD